ncbi:hypothetical protein ACQW02_21020 [Humitalea sp. 24SJ18S-53]|uniref:hypothetical protein n=1 Tax=Humitalea sp. 24SJ18S-53 TaxID=3422307 RepID=UPI003D666ABD
MASDLSTLTTLHTALSFIALATGAVVVAQLLREGARPGWTGMFLASAIATSVTGFLFPLGRILPSHLVGGIALPVLGLVLAARYAFRLDGGWRQVDAGGMVASLYLLALVAVAQAFAKLPELRAAATRSETPFNVTQAVLLAGFVVLGVAAVRAARRGRTLTA